MWVTIAISILLSKSYVLSETQTVIEEIAPGQTVSIESPNYPDQIQPNLHQVWKLKSPPGTRIKFYCYDIRLIQDNPPSCDVDVLRVNSGELIELCGSAYDFEILTSENSLEVELKTGKEKSGGVKCSADIAEDKSSEEYDSLTASVKSFKSTPPELWDIDSDEIDSSEHGGPHGQYSTTCPCGWANKKNERIIGGKETNVNGYPFMVSIHAKEEGDAPYCGGSLITETCVLTAAHCVIYGDPEDFYIKIGSHDQTKNKDTNFTETINTVKVIMHEDYMKNRPKYDIAMLVLEKPVKFNKFIGPVCLPKGPLSLGGKYVKAIGWGMQGPNSPGSAVLKQVNVRVVSNCPYYLPKVVEHQLCTYSKKKGLGRGDSGGPVVWVDPKTNRYTLVGITSYVFLYTELNLKPDVSTDVSFFLPWIKEKIRENNPKSEACWAIY